MAAELIRIFRDHGPRDARSKCRFAFLIEEWGLPRLREELSSRLGHELAPGGRDVRGSHDSDHLGVAWQKQPGFRSVGLCVPEGRIHPPQMDELARLADDYGDGQVRFTTGQNAILPNVPVERVSALLEEDLLQELSHAPSAFRRCLVACTGTDYCNLAQIDTKGHAARAGGCAGKAARCESSSGADALVWMSGRMRKSRSRRHRFPWPQDPNRGQDGGSRCHLRGWPNGATRCRGATGG